MSVTANEFIDLANRLLASTIEIDWRGGASRAYYAAFHIALDASSACADNSHFVIAGGTHAKLIDKFESWQPSDKKVQAKSRAIAYVLRDMKKTREHADYKISEPFLKSETATKISQINILRNHISTIWP